MSNLPNDPNANHLYNQRTYLIQRYIDNDISADELELLRSLLSEAEWHEIRTQRLLMRRVGPSCRNNTPVCPDRLWEEIRQELTKEIENDEKMGSAPPEKRTVHWLAASCLMAFLIAIFAVSQLSSRANAWEPIAAVSQEDSHDLDRFTQVRRKLAYSLKQCHFPSEIAQFIGIPCQLEGHSITLRAVQLFHRREGGNVMICHFECCEQPIAILVSCDVASKKLRTLPQASPFVTRSPLNIRGLDLYIRQAEHPVQPVQHLLCRWLLCGNSAG